jgi:hypothetical protein
MMGPTVSMSQKLSGMPSARPIMNIARIDRRWTAIDKGRRWKRPVLDVSVHATPSKSARSETGIASNCLVVRAARRRTAPR